MHYIAVQMEKQSPVLSNRLITYFCPDNPLYIHPPHSISFYQHHPSSVEENLLPLSQFLFKCSARTIFKSYPKIPLKNCEQLPQAALPNTLSLDFLLNLSPHISWHPSKVPVTPQGVPAAWLRITALEGQH